ncbi:MAG: oligosaccharide flippase family protein [Ginsengibacter sp.]
MKLPIKVYNSLSLKGKSNSKFKFKIKDKIVTAFGLVTGSINKGHERSIKVKKNILASFAIKGCSILISFFLVPLTINYVNPTRYGIWIALSSIIGWFSFFDIGFGNGLRNKFAESIAKGEHEIARIYVSTTYAILSILVITAILVFICINPFLDWTKILNTPSGMARELSILALIVFVFFCLQFVLQLITTVMTANLEPANASFFNLLGSVFSLLFIVILTKTTSGNLLYLALCLGFTPVLVLTASSFWFYRHEYKVYAPAIKYVKMKYARNLLGLGIKFFIIQVAVLILFETDNIIITQLFGPQEVTTFNVAYKLFSVTIMIFLIIVTPLWSAFTDAYTAGDSNWIKNTLSKMKKLWFLLIILTLLILFTSPYIFKLWIGNAITVPFSLSIALTLYVIAFMWHTMQVYFLNGIGKIRLQLIIVVISGIINIPIAIFLGRKIGLAGVTLANTVLIGIMAIVYTIQTHKIINNRATGIWNK